MSSITRREVLSAAAATGGWLVFAGDLSRAQSPATQSASATPAAAAPAGPYSLPPLPYDYADLEPHIDAPTMRLHHDVHHAGYVAGANAAVAELERIRQAGGEAIHQVRAVSDALQFNLSGHALHTLFWQNMKKNGGGEPAPESDIAAVLKRDFGSFGAFAAHFSAAAQQVQGSGWGLLAYEPLSQRLLVLQAEKHQGTATAVVPLLAIDVWEHAYYLKYQNRRSEYIKAFLNVINWENVDSRLAAARKLV